MRFRVTDICLLVPDVNRSTEFYRDKIGLPLKRQDNGFAEFEAGATSLALWEASDVEKHLGKETMSQEGHWFMGAFECESGEEVDAVYAELKGKGVNFVKEPADWPWGARGAYFTDPDGYLWEIYAWVGEPDTW